MGEPSEQTKERLRAYQDQPRLEPAQLLQRLKNGRERFLRSSEECEFADRPLALKLYAGFERLLQTPIAHEHWIWVQSALFYLLEVDDEDNDLESPLGLEDDAEVFNDVCDALGLRGLKVRVG